MERAFPNYTSYVYKPHDGEENLIVVTVKGRHSTQKYLGAYVNIVGFKVTGKATIPDIYAVKVSSITLLPCFYV